MVVDTVGVGTPVVVTVKENGVPTTTLAVEGLVMVGDGLFNASNCTAGMYHGAVLPLTLQQPESRPLSVGYVAGSSIRNTPMPANRR